MCAFLIRRARKSDARRISEVLLDWLASLPDRDRSGSIAQSIARGEIFVAICESTIVGFIHYVVHDDIIDGAPNAFITAFFVTEPMRSKGVGSALLNRVINEAVARGCVSIETSTTHRRAEYFYERHGFKQTVGDIGEVFLELDVSPQ